MMPISSAMAKASCWSWVTRMAVTPSRLRISRTSSDRRSRRSDIEVGEGLVEQDQLGARRQRAGQRHALLLAAGELMRKLVALAVQADRGQQLADALRGRPRGGPARPKATLSATLRCGKRA
jgi:hypothetical protein